MKGYKNYYPEVSKKMRIMCSNCGYIWFYKGRLGYGTCPCCQLKIRIDKNQVKEETNGGENHDSNK